MDSLVNESGSLAANISEYKVEGARTSLVDHTSTNPYQLSVSFILTNDPNPKYREAVNDIAIGSAPERHY